MREIPKGVFFDGSDACGNGNAFECRAVIESFFSDHGNAVGNGKACQITAIFEHIFGNLLQVVRQRDACKAFTFLKHAIANGCNAVGDIDACNTGCRKSIIADALQRIRQLKGFQGGAGCKSAVFDGDYLGGNGYRFKLLTIEEQTARDFRKTIGERGAYQLGAVFKDTDADADDGVGNVDFRQLFAGCKSLVVNHRRASMDLIGCFRFVFDRDQQEIRVCVAFQIAHAVCRVVLQRGASRKDV